MRHQDRECGKDPEAVKRRDPARAGGRSDWSAGSDWSGWQAWRRAEGTRRGRINASHVYRLSPIWAIDCARYYSEMAGQLVVISPVLPSCPA